MLVQCPSRGIDLTLSHLHEAGRSRRECVVLWLGKRTATNIQIEVCYRPMQSAAEDMFEIPPAGMQALHGELRQRRLMVAAQVHSHPAEAFHSRADDRWAIIRHEGALSLVLPYFAAHTTPSSFMQDAKVYRFSSAAMWTEVPGGQVQRECLEIF